MKLTFPLMREKFITTKFSYFSDDTTVTDVKL